MSEFIQDYHIYTEAAIQWAMEYGYMGAFLVSFGETVILPLFPDPFILGASAVGLNPWVMMLLVMIGTLSGAAVGYLLGKWLGHPVAVKLFGVKNIDRGEKLMNKYGIWAVVVCGLTPLPFKVAVWLAGIFEMSFGKFMLAALIGRLPRFALMAFLGQSIVKAFLN